MFLYGCMCAYTHVYIRTYTCNVATHTAIPSTSKCTCRRSNVLAGSWSATPRRLVAPHMRERWCRSDMKSRVCGACGECGPMRNCIAAK